MERKQKQQILNDLEKKIVFLVGPRQVGKTWLAKEIGKSYKNSAYLNYDSAIDREIIKKEQWSKDTDLLILDELHKMKGWKNYLKGLYDTKDANLRILVTGSSRLEVHRKIGDSLAGRFFVHHLLPFSISEINTNIDFLELRGGFPEPFLSTKDTDAQRWRSQYVDSLIRQDVLNFQTVMDLNTMQHLFDLLRRKVGSTISYSSLAGVLEISPATVKKYIQILEALYIIFQISPFSKKISRSLLREPKIYFYDNGLVVGDEGAKFENLLASSLLKHILGKNDYLGETNNLQYIRTKDGREVDFVLVNTKGEIEEMLEAKVSDREVSKNLKYFFERYNVPSKQVVKNLKREANVGGIEVVMADKYLKRLFL